MSKFQKFSNKKTKMPGTGRLQDKRTVQQNQNSSKMALPIRRAQKFGIYKKVSTRKVSKNFQVIEKFQQLVLPIVPKVNVSDIKEANV